jgi:hypothetical protein
MGTDIHLIVEHKKDGKWQRIDPPDFYPRDPWILKQILKAETEETDEQRADPDGMYQYYINKRDHDWYSGRSYKLFAMLANVRNGSGFAGIKTGEGYKPISLPKGLPPDLSVPVADETEQPGAFDFGYHDFSYLTLKELLDYDWTQKTNNTGIISWEQFVERQEKGITGEPDTYCGYISDAKMVTEEKALQLYSGGVRKDQPPGVTHVQIWWEQSYADSAHGFYKNLIPTLQQIEPNPEDIRIVFGFDS